MKLILCCVILVALSAASRADEKASPEDHLRQAAAAAERGEHDAAILHATAAVEADPQSVRARFVRGQIYESQRQYAAAVADYDEVLKLDPRYVPGWSARGGAKFKLGRIEESIADWDRQIELSPADEPGHWRRGISHYYAGRYDDGRRQFEGYQTVDDADVENAVWRYLCMARAENAEAAVRDLLEIGDDRRVPMRQVYEMFAGRLTPDDVLAAARAGEPDEAALNERLFYAELYIGLWHEAKGDAEAAQEHIACAADEHEIGHYMWDVARVHAERLRSEDDR